MKKIVLLFLILLIGACKSGKKEDAIPNDSSNSISVKHAKGFSIETSELGITLIKVDKPWPNAKKVFTYALVPKEKMASITLNKETYDAIIGVPVERLVATSTTHIPALEALGAEDKLVGFPETDYISSENTRKRIETGFIKDLGTNAAINTEMTIALNPEIVFGFGIDGQNRAYETLQRSNIPVVYNGDWAEETPLGKAEWIKFFAPFFQQEDKATQIFEEIEDSYLKAKDLAKKAEKIPTVISGALYKDVWYLPGGDSWAAQFLRDANTHYLWEDSKGTGSLSLSVESVLEKGQESDFWLSPSQFTSYAAMEGANTHYGQIKAFQEKKIYTFAKTRGATNGLLYYELAPQRPDLVLKDLIHIFHPTLLPRHEAVFFKPLD